MTTTIVTTTKTAPPQDRPTHGDLVRFETDTGACGTGVVSVTGVVVLHAEDPRELRVGDYLQGLQLQSLTKWHGKVTLTS